MDKEKEILKKELCINNNEERKNKVVQKRDVPTPPQFHKSVTNLFGTVAEIYKGNKRQEYSINSFKSSLALYVGFHERNIGPRFNLLASLGVIEISKIRDRNRKDAIFLNIENLLEFSFDKEVYEIWKEKQKEESK